MDLAAVEERGVQVVLPLEILRGAVPIRDVVVAVLAVGRVLVTDFQFPLLAVVHLVDRAPVEIPVMLLLVAARTFVARSRRVEHVAFGVLQRIPVVSQPSRYRNPVASLVQPERVIGQQLRELLLVGVAIMAVVESVVYHIGPLHAMLVIAHVAAPGVLGVAALEFQRQSVAA